MLLGMLLVPSSVRGAVYNFDWHYWNNGAAGAYLHDSGQDENCNGYIIMSGNDYEDIEGAQTVTRVQCRLKNQNGNYSTSKWEIEERLAFVLNTAGKGNAYNGNNGWYLRAESNNNGGYTHQGLYTGCWNSKLAILSLRGGDKVTISFEAGDHVSQHGAGIHYNQSVHCHRGDNNDIYYNQNAYLTSKQTLYITSSGDLIVDANIGTYITNIKIETTDVAKYKTGKEGLNKHTFEFTGNGVLDDNDFALDYLSFQMGSQNDYLSIQNLEAHMVKPNGTEDLETDGNNHWQPSAGSFYSFKPTANGTITINQGSIQGNNIHVFVYNPNLGYNDNWEMNNGNFYKYTFTNVPFSFQVEKGKTYYICQDNQHESGNALHLRKFTFETNFYVKDLGVVIDNVDGIQGDAVQITQVEPDGGYQLKVKRCSGNISPAMTAEIRNGWLYMSKPTFADGTDHAGTVIWDLVSDGGEATIVVTFPYHANYNPSGHSDPYRTYGHTWNFIDPRNSDSNIGNCLIRTGMSSFAPGTATGILSIGQYNDHSSQFYGEVEKREWAYAQRITGTAGGFHDPMYKNCFDMVGDNADMIWETEGLIFETSPNLSCIYNENDAVDQSKTNPLDFQNLGNTDPDRYVGILPVVQSTDFSSFKIPCLKDGDRVLIFMKSGESSGKDGINLKVEGAKDALGEDIDPNVVYSAGGTNWQHNRYEGCYHFIKKGNGDMKFSMLSGSMCKLMYIRIYSGARIPTNSITSQNSQEDDPGRLLFMNDKGATTGSSSTLTLHFRDKGQQQKADILTCSGNLNYKLSVKKNHNEDEKDDHFTVGGTYYQSIGFTSKVGEIGMFRLRLRDVEYNENYTADFSDRNFTVGYRDKVDSYPYTWDFTDIQGFSSTAMSTEANKYPIDDATNDLYGNEWDISLFDTNGYMKLNSGYDPSDHNIIFSPHKIGYGNQLWAGSGAIPETRGLWFYSEDDDDTEFDKTYYTSLYNDCLQITSEGIRFANIPDTQGKRVAWWNYKMVVPDVPANAAVYLRMKRDLSVSDDAKTWSVIDNDYVPFVATRFHFGNNPKTQLFTDSPVENGSNYSFYQVPGTTDEYILAIKNTTGATNHLTYTLNGWIVKKLAVAKEEDAKSIYSTGFATESRSHDVDHTLTSYMTGLPIKAYMVTNAVASTAEQIGFVTVTPVEFTNNSNKNAVLPANTGCFLANDMYNEEATDKSVNVLNNQTHLFVPDMHDTNNYVSTSGNMMKARAEAGIIDATEGSMTNFVLSNRYVKVENPTKILLSNKVNFYRVIQGGATTNANSAYLQIPTSTAAGAKAFFLVMEGTEDPLAEDFGDQDITAVKGIENAADIEGDWYNMNGQKLNGRPTSSGIYVVNGKKVVIK